MAGSSRPTVAAVIVGSELLSGKIEDCNTPYLARKLRAAGLALRKVTVVPDEAPLLEAALREGLALADHVFSSGGIGPTHDDITAACVARVLEVPLERHPEMEALLRELIGARINEVHLRMANLPRGTELIVREGMIFPALRCGRIYILPGIPEIFREKVDQILPALGGRPYHLAELRLRTGESSLAPHLEAVLAAHPGIEIGSYPSLDTGEGFQVRVTLEGAERDRVQAALEALLARLPAERVLERRDASASA
ncbi:MAG: molybdopterin-binding protein [Deltaproteobacteria bacterium]|nr:molybdopterin-binding protein [Deltaproteobacteria bacterium]